MGYTIDDNGKKVNYFNTDNEALQDFYKRVSSSSDSIKPSYYNVNDTYEVFNVLEAWGLDKDFYLGNVIKYVVRAGKKNPEKYKEDLNKALIYLQKRIDSIK